MFTTPTDGTTNLPLVKVRNNANLSINQVEGFLDLKIAMSEMEQNVINHINVGSRNNEEAEKSHQDTSLVSRSA